MIKFTYYQQTLVDSLRAAKHGNSFVAWLGIFAVYCMGATYLEVALGNPPPAVLAEFIRGCVIAYIIINISYVLVQLANYWLYCRIRGGLRYLKNVCTLPPEHKARQNMLEADLKVIKSPKHAILNTCFPVYRTIIDFLMDWFLVIMLWRTDHETLAALLNVALIIQYAMIYFLDVLVLETIALLPDPIPEKVEVPEKEVPEKEVEVLVETKPDPQPKSKDEVLKSSKDEIPKEYDINELMSKLTNGE